MAANISENVTVIFEAQNISMPVVILIRTQGTLIVLLNLVVLVTLASKKSKFPAVYWLQIFCLAFNDMLAGVANFLFSLIDSPYIRESLNNCTIALIFLFSSQSASLYNIFGICVHRFIVLKRADLRSSVWKHRHTVLSTSIAWTLSLFLCSLPMALYNKPEDYNKLKVCSLNSIFGKDVDKSTFILIGSFIFPLIFTNVLYISLFCILKSDLKTVRPVSSQSELGASRSVSSILTGSYSNRATMVTDISNQSFSLAMRRLHAEGSREHIERKSTRSNLFLKVPERRQTLIRLSVNEPSPSTSTEQVTPYTRRRHEPNNSSHGDHITKARQYIIPPAIVRQRKAFTLLGIILLFLNIFTWPAVISLFLASKINTLSLDRNTLLPLFTTICFNSAVNPILYTATISEFRSALLDVLFSIYKFFKH